MSVCRLSLHLPCVISINFRKSYELNFSQNRLETPATANDLLICCMVTQEELELAGEFSELHKIIDVQLVNKIPRVFF